MGLSVGTGVGCGVGTEVGTCKNERKKRLSPKQTQMTERNMRRDSGVALSSKGGMFTGVGSEVGREVGALLGIGVGSWRRTIMSGKVQLQYSQVRTSSIDERWV